MGSWNRSLPHERFMNGRLRSTRQSSLGRPTFSKQKFAAAKRRVGHSIGLQNCQTESNYFLCGPKRFPCHQKLLTCQIQFAFAPEWLGKFLAVRVSSWNS